MTFFHPFKTMRAALFATPLLAAPLLATGCFVVDDAALTRLVPTPEVDAGTVATSETCGGAGAISVMAGVYSVANGNAIDTRTASNDVNPTLCVAAPGPEVFVQFEASAAQYWHFHVHPNNPAPTDGGAPIIGDPVLLLYQVQNGTCNTTQCANVSNRCPAGQDEHFGLEIPSTGTWALGIDNATAFGSLYDVTVFRPTCGMNGPEHGEGCDDGNLVAGDGCDDKCRVEIAATNTIEAEPNDDRFWANHVLVDPSNGPFLLPGTHLVCDSDVYMVRITAGQHLTARLKNSTGATYFTPGNIPFGFTAHTATGAPVSYSADGTAGATLGSAVIDVTVASGSADYFVYVTPPSDVSLDALQSYKIELDVN